MNKPYWQLRNDLNARAQRAHAPGHLTLADLELVLKHYGGKCLVPECGRTDITFDHVKPLELGGANDVTNLQLLCTTHNVAKGDTEKDYRNGDIVTRDSAQISNTYGVGAYCQAKTKNGKPCSAYAIEGSRFCFTHDPRRAAERAIAHKKGGENRSRAHNSAPFPSADVKTGSGLLALMEQVFKDTWTLDLSVARSRTLGYLAQVQKGVLEVGELEQRIKRLEDLAAERGSVAASRASDNGAKQNGQLTKTH